MRFLDAANSIIDKEKERLMKRFYNCEDLTRILHEGRPDEFIIYTHIKADGFSAAVTSRIEEIAKNEDFSVCVYGYYNDNIETGNLRLRNFEPDHVEFVGFNSALLSDKRFREMASISPSHAYWALIDRGHFFAESFALHLDGVTEEYLSKLREEYEYSYEEMILNGLNVGTANGISEVI